MRRHRLKTRIRRQRRITHRLATRHPMAHRRPAGVRMLQALGEWVEESGEPLRFAPALVPAATQPPPNAPDMEWASPEPAEDAADVTPPVQEPDEEIAIAVDASLDQPAVGPPRHDHEPSAASARFEPTPNVGEETSVPEEPRVASAPGGIPPAAGATATPSTAPRTDSPRSPVQRSTRLADAPPPQAADADAVVNRADPVASTSQSVTPSPSAPASPPLPPATGRTEHAIIVERALAALRASGELRRGVRTEREPMDRNAPARARVPVARPAPEVGSDPPIADVTTHQAAPPDVAVRATIASNADDTSVPATPEAKAEPTVVPTDGARFEPAAFTRVDERRHGRRLPPRPLTGTEGTAGAEAVTHTAQPRPVPAPTSTPHRSADVNRGQFQFTDVDRTPQEWRRLLIEALSPPPPAATRSRQSAPVTGAKPEAAAADRDQRSIEPTQPAQPPQRSVPAARTAEAVGAGPADARAPRRSPGADLPTKAVRPHRPSAVPNVAPAARTKAAPTAAQAGRPRDSRPPDTRQDGNPPPTSASSPGGPKERPAARERETGVNTLGRTPGSPVSMAPTASAATRDISAQHRLPDESPLVAAASLADATSPNAGASAPEAIAPASRGVASRPTRVGAHQGQVEPAPVSPSLRRFLEPLVGIDPDTVRVHRGDHAARLAAAHDADAVAFGDEIALGAGHDERDPSTAGLLAHELTHVARSRGSRFVPPIVRGAWKPTEHPAVHRPASVRGIDAATTGEAPLPDDEETMARVVETRVRDAAARERAVPVSTFLESTVDRDEGHPAAEPSRPEPGRASRSAGRNTSAQSWGSLPAPWEPLPSFLVQDREGCGSWTAEPNGSVPPGAIAAPTTPVGAASPAPVVQRAEHGGSGNSEQPARAGSHSAYDEGDGAPDVDALARQVYDVLRRRLAAERRRGA